MNQSGASSKPYPNGNNNGYGSYHQNDQSTGEGLFEPMIIRDPGQGNVGAVLTGQQADLP